MATVIKFPGLPTGMTLTVDVVAPTALTVSETVTLTESSGIYTGTISAALTGQYLFVMKASGSRIGYRLRTIGSDAGPYIIVTEYETVSSDGRGLYVATLTITDGVDPILGATVRIVAAGVTAERTTDASGIAKFALDNGTYDVIISKVGYEASVESLTVSGTTSDAYVLTEIVITPPSSPLVATGYMVVYDEFALIEPDVPISVQMSSGPGTVGYALDTKARTVLSDIDGYIEFIGLIRGATYSVWRGAASGTTAVELGFTSIGGSPGSSASFLVPNLDTFSIPEVLGTDVEV